MKLASVTGNRNYNYIKYGFEIDFKGELKNGMEFRVTL